MNRQSRASGVPKRLGGANCSRPTLEQKGRRQGANDIFQSHVAMGQKPMPPFLGRMNTQVLPVLMFTRTGFDHHVDGLKRCGWLSESSAVSAEFFYVLQKGKNDVIVFHIYGCVGTCKLPKRLYGYLATDLWTLSLFG